ncbi:hypothetical protein BH09SUM1_BH09SUM1_13080 [soil metagenome]
MASKTPSHRDGRAALLPYRVTKLSMIVMALIMVAALIEIQFSVASWKLVYGTIQDLNLSRYLDAANQFPSSLTFVALVIPIWIYKPKIRHTIAPMLIALGMASLLAGVIKETAGRARPQVGVRLMKSDRKVKGLEEFLAVHPNPVLKIANSDYWLWFSPNRPRFKGDYASFPSGHAVSAVVLAFWLTLMFPRAKVIWYMLAVGTCLARIKEARHYPGDVMFGSGVGFFTACYVFSAPWALRFGIWTAEGGEKLFRMQPKPNDQIED